MNPRDSFLLNIRLNYAAGPRSIARFRNNYGEDAFEAVKADLQKFKVDLDSGKIEIIPIDPLPEVEAIVNITKRNSLGGTSI